MSGNAFKDFKPQRVTYDDYLVLREIIKGFISEHRLKEIGSAQIFCEGVRTYERTLGDLDFAVGLPKVEILKIVKAHPDTFQLVKVFGNTVSTLVYNPRIKNVQHVDFMTSTNVHNEKWVMTGGSEVFKGVVRNLMLCYLAKVQNTKESTEERTVKHTVAFPSGVATKINGVQVTERDNHPNAILRTLGLNCSNQSVDSARTYEGLLGILEDAQSHYTGFKQYCEESYFYRKSPVLLDRALDYLKNFE